MWLWSWLGLRERERVGGGGGVACQSGAVGLRHCERGEALKGRLLFSEQLASQMALDCISRPACWPSSGKDRNRIIQEHNL